MAQLNRSLGGSRTLEADSQVREQGCPGRSLWNAEDTTVFSPQVQRQRFRRRQVPLRKPMPAGFLNADHAAAGLAQMIVLSHAASCT